VFPKLGHKPLDKRLAPEAIKALKPLAAKGNLETTRKIISHLNNVMNHAVNTGILHHNPLSGTRSAELTRNFICFFVFIKLYPDKYF